MIRQAYEGEGGWTESTIFFTGFLGGIPLGMKVQMKPRNIKSLYVAYER
jgi:hypothetical protein